MAILLQSLETLNRQLDQADSCIEEVELRAHQAGTTLDNLRGQFVAESQKVLPLASAVTSRLDTGQQKAEQSLNRLHGNLEGLEGELRQRKEATQTRVRLLISAVQQLSVVLKRVHGEFLAEQLRTEDALTKAGERSAQAFKSSREALEALNLMVRQDFLTQLSKHEESTRLAQEGLAKKVGELVPAIEALVKDTKTKIDAIVDNLRLQSEAQALEARKNADECLAESRLGATTMVNTLTGHSEESAGLLDSVTSLMQTELANESKMEATLVQALGTAVPHAAELQKIPVRLKEVLKSARIVC